MPRVTKITKTRNYRLTKKHPRRAVASMKFDLGNVEQQITLFFPRESRYVSVGIPKEKNPNLYTIYLGNVKICWYFDEEKGFVFDENGIYCGKYRKHDLKNLFSEIGYLLKLIKNRKD